MGRKHKPAGTPQGGEFARSRHDEPTVSIAVGGDLDVDDWIGPNGFDPNEWGRVGIGPEESDRWAELGAGPDTACGLKAVGISAFEAGSIWDDGVSKPTTIAGAVESGQVTASEVANARDQSPMVDVGF